MNNYKWYIFSLLLTSVFSAHAMKLKINKNKFKTTYFSKSISNKLLRLKHDTFNNVKTVQAIDTHIPKHLFHTTTPIVHSNDDLQVSYIKKYDDEESGTNKENMLIKIKKKPVEFIKTFMKIKVLKETSEKNVYLNNIGQKLSYNPGDKKFYFDPREVRILTNGPIFGAIGYVGTYILGYSVGVAAVTTAVVTTGGAAAAAGGVTRFVTGGAVGIGTTAVTTGVTASMATTAGVLGGAIASTATGAAVSTAVATTAVATAPTVAGLHGLIGCAANAVGGFLAACPILP